jgi:hypothetical protein
MLVAAIAALLLVHSVHAQLNKTQAAAVSEYVSLSRAPGADAWCHQAMMLPAAMQRLQHPSRSPDRFQTACMHAILPKTAFAGIRHWHVRRIAALLHQCRCPLRMYIPLHWSLMYLLAPLYTFMSRGSCCGCLKPALTCCGSATLNAKL